MENITRTCCLLLATGGLFFAASAEAQLLKNGDFSNNRSHWEGAGQIVTLNDAGEPAKPEDGGQPMLEVKLSKQKVTEVRQRVVHAQDLRAFKAEAVVKASSDFQRNDKAQPHAKDAKDINWDVGGWYSRDKIYYPRVDFCMRVSGPNLKGASMYYYAPRALKPGGDWQTIKGSFKEMGPRGNKVFAIILPAGEGTVWVKSVQADPL